MKTKPRIAVYGGTFNPPHIAHVRAAESFYFAIKPDVLMIIPDFLPPHKEFQGTVSASQRLDMCRLAFGHIENTVVSDIEIKREGKSYTAVTLTELSKEAEELYFLCGTDMFLTLDSWYHPEIIFEKAVICYVRRESDEKNDTLIAEKTKKYLSDFGARIIPIDLAVTELSSCEVRRLLKDSGDFSGLIPDSVLEYINEKGLYR